MISNPPDNHDLIDHLEWQIQYQAQHLLFEPINDDTITELNTIATQIVNSVLPGYNIRVEQDELKAGDVNFILNTTPEDSQLISLHAVITEDGFLEPK